jgi:hypothetical protein
VYFQELPGRDDHWIASIPIHIPDLKRVGEKMPDKRAERKRSPAL